MIGYWAGGAWACATQTNAARTRMRTEGRLSMASSPFERATVARRVYRRSIIGGIARPAPGRGAWLNSRKASSPARRARGLPVRPGGVAGSVHPALRRVLLPVSARVGKDVAVLVDVDVVRGLERAVRRGLARLRVGVHDPGRRRGKRAADLGADAGAVGAVEIPVGRIRRASPGRIGCGVGVPGRPDPGRVDVAGAVDHDAVRRRDRSEVAGRVALVDEADRRAIDADVGHEVHRRARRESSRSHPEGSPPGSMARSAWAS